MRLEANRIKQRLKSTPLYGALHPVVSYFLFQNEARRWESAGRVGPPPHLVKQATVRQYGSRFGLDTLVETGTYMGDMVAALRSDFVRIYSIELDEQLYRFACRRFRGHLRISLLQGDSSVVLPSLLASISSPCLFWLDGHYSGGTTARAGRNTPIVDELQAIVRHSVRGHVILIDDARCFVGKDDYPTIEELRQLVARLRSNLQFQVLEDIIRIHEGWGAS